MSSAIQFANSSRKYNSDEEKEENIQSMKYNIEGIQRFWCIKKQYESVLRALALY